MIRLLADSRSPRDFVSSARPSISTATKLPPELLSEIFLYVRDAQTSHHMAVLRYTLRAIHWIKVTHVCRYWRQVALNCQRLWSNIPIISTTAVQVLLSRAPRVPLSLRCLHQLSTIEAFTIAMQELPRTCSLNFRGPKAWLPNLTTLTPLLESLSLHRTDTRVTSSDYGLPGMFVKGSFPKLRSIELSGYHFLWDNAIFSPALRCLRVSSWLGRPSSLNRTMDALASMPLLEDLDLHRMFPVDPSQPLSPSRITLPNLRTFRLSDNATVCARALERIIFPACTRVVLECHCDIGPIDGVAMLSSTLRAKLTDSSITIGHPSPLVNFSAEHRCLGPPEQPSIYTLHVNGWCEDQPRLTFSRSQSVSLSISLFSTRLYTVADLCTGWPLSNVSKLAIASSGMFNAQEATEMWRSLILTPGQLFATEVTNGGAQLCAVSVSGHDLLAALVELLPSRVRVNTEPNPSSTQTRSGRRLEHTRPVLASLQSLFIHNINFRQETNGEDDADEIERTTTSQSLSNLCSALRARKRARASIKELGLSHCQSLTADEKKMLNGIVPLVVYPL